MKIQIIACKRMLCELRDANMLLILFEIYSLYIVDKERECKTYSQINILRRHCLFEFHLVFGHLSRVIILRVSSIKRFRRMPNIIAGAFKRRMWSCRCKILRRIVRDANIARSLKFKYFIFR